MTAIKAAMVDVSSNNEPITAKDLEEHYAAGYRVFMPKATQSTTYTWTEGGELTRIWHSLGTDAVAWRYHFNGLTGSASAQASYFHRAIAPTWRDGDRWILDVEAIPLGGGKFAPSFSGAQADQFQERMHALETEWPSGIYGSPYLLRGRGVKPAHGAILMLADYASSIAFVPPGWSKVAAWQYTDRATGVPGIPGATDRSTLDASVMPAEHAGKPVGSPLACRPQAHTVVEMLSKRTKPIEAGHGDRALVAALVAQGTRTLAIKKG